MNRRNAVHHLAIGALAAALPTFASAQAAWPTAKPITYVVPFTAGGSTDVMGGTISTHAINASLYKNLPYDPVNDFEPVALVAYLPNVLLVDQNLGVNSVAELIALLTHIAYKGTPPAMVDVPSGQVTFMFDQMTAALPLIQAGKLKLLAVTTGKRMALSPATPTMIEAGVPGFEMFSWQAVYAPKGTPKPIVDRLNAEIVKALKQPDVKDKLAGLGMEVVGSSPAELAALMAREIPRWETLVKKSGASTN